MNRKYENPYIPAKGEAFSLLQSHILPADYDFIRCIRPTTGTVRITVNLMWKALVESLKSYGITDITSKSEFESFVANLKIVDGRDTGDATHSSGGTPTGSVARRRR
jgi:hypothetical protein